jgi:spermidine synthase
MSRRFEELDWRETPMGAISLRRRWEPTLGVDVFEAKLDDDFLMSSLFVVAEVELARLGLAAVEGDGLRVLVGGLGLGYTAVTALEDPRVGSLVVVEALPEVVRWHDRGLLPASPALGADERCRLVTADFFATVGAGLPLEEPAAHDWYDALLVDIDHSPRHVLHPSHQGFYGVEGLTRMRTRLRPGGVFALWSDDPPDEGFLRSLDRAFRSVTAHVVEFDNHLTGGTSANTVYVASTG